MKEINRRSLTVGLRLFLAMTVIAGMAVMVFSTKGIGLGDLARRETWVMLLKVETWFDVFRGLVNAFGNMKLSFILLATAATFGRFYMDILRVQILSKAAGRWMPFRSSAEFNLGGLFLGAITPFQSGGIPLQLYILSRLGLSLGAGGAVVAFRGILTGIVFVLVLPVMLLFFREFLVSSVIQSLTRYLAVLYSVMLILLLAVLLRAEGVKRFLLSFDAFLRRRRVVRTDRFERFYHGLFEQIEEFRRCARDYFGGKRALVSAAFLVSCGGVILSAILAPAILYGLGQTPSVLASFMMAVLLLYVLAFVPTPGASGFAEMGAYSLFLLVSDRSSLGFFVLLWRFFTLYLGALLGGFLLLRMLKAGSTGSLVFERSSLTRS